MLLFRKLTLWECYTLKHVTKQDMFLFATTKAEFLQEGILFGTQFSSLGIFIDKKVEFRKN